MTASERIKFIASGLKPTQTASPRNSQRAGDSVQSHTIGNQFGRSINFGRAKSEGSPSREAIISNPHGNGSHSWRICLAFSSSQPEASQRSLRPAQETKSSKLRDSLVQSACLEKKLAVVMNGGLQVWTKGVKGSPSLLSGY